MNITKKIKIKYLLLFIIINKINNLIFNLKNEKYKKHLKILLNY